MLRLISWLLLITFLPLLPAQAEAGDNLLVNGDFESVDASGLPVGWSPDMWYTGESVSRLSVEEGGPEGGRCVRVENLSENDARFLQEVEVEPDTVYRLSCLVRAEGCGLEASGAGISVRDTFASSEYAYDTQGDWTLLTLVGRTGPEQTRLGVFLRLGGYSSLNTGVAWFDDVSMERLDQAPEGVEVANFTPYDYSASKASDEDDGEPQRNTEAFVLMAALYVLAVVAFARKKRAPTLQSGSGADGRLYLAVITAALVFRVAVALKVRGYNTDITCFEAWSERIFANGIRGFYSPDYFCDYPPGYILMLWPCALLRRLFGTGYNSTLHVLLVKLIPIACDLVGAHLVYRFARERLGARPALLLASFYALNPAVLVDSAAWGQIDSVLTLLVVLCLLEMVRGRYAAALPLYALAVLVKPQALLFGPLGLAVLLAGLFLVPTDQRSRGQTALSMLYGLLAALGLICITAFLFCPSGFSGGLLSPFKWLVDLYAATLQSYPYFSLNALNLYVLLDLNWTQVALHPNINVLSWALFAASYVYAAVIYLLSRDRKKLALSAATLLILLCTFGPKIHERYVYPALLMLALAYIEDRDIRLLGCGIALTATLFLNQVLVLQGGLTPANYGHLHDSERWLNLSVSLVNVLLAGVMAYTSFDLCVRRHPIPLKDPEEDGPSSPVLRPQDPALHLTRWDVLLMAGITLAYSIAAFTNLGTTSAPQSSWVSSAAGESITFELDGVHSFRMIYYGGIADSTFTVELSNDGAHWTEPSLAPYDQGEIFRWIYFVPSNSDLDPIYGQTSYSEDGSAFMTFASSLDRHPFQTARFIRLTAQRSGLVLSEVAFQDPEGELLPIRALTRSGAAEDAEGPENDPMRLMDEQNTVPDHPSYYNSTYFDEIYHARTAYEHLNELNTYEWTHPPLGKVLMMVGIQLFGMTPFGWRFMGALMGVLMLPVMYLLAKQLTKSTPLAAVASFLMAVDSMHFTQTRIATIDSYAVLFIMVMYLFMFRYSQMNWNRQSLGRTLVPLGLCGLFMGFSCATKWIGLYASVGIAIIFFHTLCQRTKEYPGKNTGYARILLHFLCGVVCLLGAGLCALAAGLKASDADVLTLLPYSLSSLSWTVWLMVALVLLALAGAWTLLLTRELLRRTAYQQEYWRNLFVTLLCCLVFFVAVPLVIYYFSYYWQLRPEAGGLNVKRVIELQKQMLGYHAGLSGDTHYFRSPWYQWPVIAWPMWYYSGTDYVPSGFISSISCMGNPAVWWTGLAALVFLCFRFSWKRRADRIDLLLIVGFASQFLPWVLVPRSTFIYHYFASVPFIILCIVAVLDSLQARWPRVSRASAAVLCGVALFLFVAFYPLESGLPVLRSYARLLRWFNWFNY